MRKGTVFPSLENAEIPNDSGKEYDWRLHEEISLLLHPRLVQVEHNRISRFVGIRYVAHEIGVYRIATMRPPRVVEVDHVKLRLDFISFRVMQQMIVHNRGEVGIFEVVAVDGKTFFDLLLDEIIDDGIGLTAARCS